MLLPCRRVARSDHPYTLQFPAPRWLESLCSCLHSSASLPFISQTTGIRTTLSILFSAIPFPIFHLHPLFPQAPFASYCLPSSLPEASTKFKTSPISPSAAFVSIHFIALLGGRDQLLWRAPKHFCGQVSNPRSFWLTRLCLIQSNLKVPVSR